MSMDTPDPPVTAIRFADEGFAYVDGEVLVSGEEGRDRAKELLQLDPVAANDTWWRFVGTDNVIEIVEVLESQGLQAQPNHVFFAHPCGPDCPPHPSLAYELLSEGWWANPLKANPLKANPLKANPLKANPLKANHPMENSAVPAMGRELPDRQMAGPGAAPRVVVLDTGVARPPAVGANVAAVNHCPPFIQNALNIGGVADLPDAPMPPLARDWFLDPVAGHGTFIAGLIEQLAPGCPIDVQKVIGVRGEVSETDLAAAIDKVVAGPSVGQTIISISLGGPALDVPALLRQSVAKARLAGIPIVASAGNDGTCARQYPAAFPGVVAVGALGSDGPTPWTNYGDWVDACAPGCDLVSAFFDHFNGRFPRINTVDLDEFKGWATWSGTSFSAPVVVAALCREIVQSGCTAVDAVRRVVRAKHLMRIPCLGTVVNI